jgi:hypothetical protein
MERYTTVIYGTYLYSPWNHALQIAVLPILIDCIVLYTIIRLSVSINRLIENFVCRFYFPAVATPPLSSAFSLTRLPIRHCLIMIEGKVGVGGNGKLLCTAPSARPSGLQRARALMLICSARVGCAQLRIRTFVVIGSIRRFESVH